MTKNSYTFPTFTICGKMPTNKTKVCTPPSIYTVTVGSKGQIVIPKEARDTLGISTGDKVILIAKDDSIMCLPADHMQHFVQLMQQQLEQSSST